MFSSSNFKSSDVKKVTPVIRPGEVIGFVRDITISSPPYDSEAYDITVLIESEPVLDPSFVGLNKDRNNSSAGTYAGQVGYVKSGQYNFKDYMPKNGKGNIYKKEDQIFKWLMSFATSVGKLKVIEDAGGISGDTIDEFVYNMKKFLVDDENLVRFTVAGKEFDKDGYTNYRLFFPRIDSNKLPYVKEGADMKDFQHYDESKHIVKMAASATSETEESPFFESSTPAIKPGISEL